MLERERVKGYNRRSVNDSWSADANNFNSLVTDYLLYLLEYSFTLFSTVISIIWHNILHKLAVLLLKGTELQIIDSIVKVLELQLTGWCQNKWISSTCNLPSKHCDITEILLKVKHQTNNQSINSLKLQMSSILTLNLF